MLRRPAHRIAVSGFLLAVAVSGLTACRTSPSVAAYVGDDQVRVSELEAAVAERTDVAAIAAYAARDEAAYDRRVLTLLVQGELHDAAAERYGADVTENEVGSRIEALLGSDDPDTVFDQLAQQGIARADVVESVRQQLVRQEIAVAEGAVQQPSEAELRAQYDEVREQLAEVGFGYINVPDQATADAVQAELQADPSRYAEVAARFAGEFTLPEIDQRPLSEIPGPLAQQVATAAPNSVSTLTVPDVEGVLVTAVGETVYPTFEELRPQLEQQFVQAADTAGAALVEEVRRDLDVVVNPRYGELGETGELVPLDGGVVQLLEEQGAGGGAGE